MRVWPRAGAKCANIEDMFMSGSLVSTPKTIYFDFQLTSCLLVLKRREPQPLRAEMFYVYPQKSEWRRPIASRQSVFLRRQLEHFWNIRYVIVTLRIDVVKRGRETGPAEACGIFTIYLKFPVSQGGRKKNKPFLSKRLPREK